MTFISSCVIAPAIEEFTKGIGLFNLKNKIDEKEDSVIYFIIGLGFASIENFFYSGTVSPISSL